MDERLVNRFDYDGDYGTVLNRFLMQAAVGHPLTVYGTGGQTRAFIHIRDTVQCIRLAVENPPAVDERVQIFNQATETYCVRELAELVSEMTGAEVRYYDNPRKEDPVNSLTVCNKKFLGLGLKPCTLNEGLLQEVMDIAGRYVERCDLSKIISDSGWTPETSIDRKGSSEPRTDCRTGRQSAPPSSPLRAEDQYSMTGNCERN
jgi:UDP-sulfoquinovose synthase